MLSGWTYSTAASAAARFLSSGVMDLPVASQAFNYDNPL
jgi:hypothetical protein